ncbi:recombinase family protein [Sphingomonas sp. Leaf21]|uniref:recombinase family protein n=1 Tax=Sphingomonas sp. Leaf21 TaxID=2876550 RepID=UPI0022A83FC4|nr:recombinase family protein [Sphingomonas sp. Leaf21]
MEAQRSALLGSIVQPFDKEFFDKNVSGSVLAQDRPGFAALLEYIREGDRLHVTAIDRLGRDALDIQATVRALMAKKVEVVVPTLGTITSGGRGGRVGRAGQSPRRRRRTERECQRAILSTGAGIAGCRAAGSLRMVDDRRGERARKRRCPGFGRQGWPARGKHRLAGFAGWAAQ